MPEKKKQHFVPRFYLKNFSRDSLDRDANAICVFNLKRKIHIPEASISGQCQGDYLYSKDTRVEDAFKIMEDKAALIIGEMITNYARPKVYSDQHLDFLDFLNLQKYRTVSAGKILDEMHTRMARFILKTKESKLRKEMGEEKYDEMKKKGFSIDLLEAGVEYPEFYSVKETRREGMVLADLCLKILVNKTDVEFITSDAPVIFFNQWCQDLPFGGNTGAACSGLQVFYPLSKEVVAVLFDSCIYLTERDQSVIYLDKTEDIVQINSLQLLTADENLYYSGNAKTKEMIDRLPLEVNDRPEDSMVYEESEVDVQMPGKKGKILLFNQKQSALKLNLSQMKIQKSKNKIEIKNRDKKVRTIAERVIKVIEPTLKVPSGDEKLMVFPRTLL